MVDDGLTDIVAGGFDAGIRPGGRVRARHGRGAGDAGVAPRDRRVAGLFRDSPRATHAARFGGPRLHQLPLGAERGTLPMPFERDGETLDVLIEGPLTLNDTNLIMAAALDGVAWRAPSTAWPPAIWRQDA